MGSNLFLITEIFIAVNFLFAILLVFFERKNPTSTLAWLLVFSFLPLLGFILYLFIGQNLRKKRVFSLKEAEDTRQKNSQMREMVKNKLNQLDFNNLNTIKFLDMIQMHYVSAQALYTCDNSVEIYTDGRDKFRELVKSLNSARESIHLEYYIFRNDSIGKTILNILEKKAAAGVEVRLIYDAIGAINLTYYSFARLKKNHGKVASFFPSILYYFNLRINYRNHRKIAIIDGAEAFVGGFNIGDEYLGLDKKFGYWRDTHLKIRGSAVSSLQMQFLLDWQFAADEKVEFSPKYFPRRSKEGSTALQIVSSGPDSEWSAIKNGFFKIISTAKKYVYLQTPYLIPDESILQALKVAALSGIDVRIMIPDKPDQPFVHWASFSYAVELLDSGVRCYMYNKGFLHSKVIIADDLVGSVGTANIDMRSFNLNFEVNAFIYDPVIINRLEKAFREDLTFCTEITRAIYQQRPVWYKFKESVSRLLSPLL